MSKFVITLVVFSLYSMSFASTPPIRQELGNNWQFRQYHIGKWLPAEVPGTVHTDLINNGIIEDPFYRDNEKHIQWIDKADWEYELRFQVDEQLAGQKHKQLVFQGLDTWCDITLNGQPLLSTNNMFRTWKADVSGLLSDKENILHLRFRSPIRQGMKEMEKYGLPLPASNDQSENGGMGPNRVSVFSRKAPYHFGWDWGPRLVTSGIWRPIFLEGWDDLNIEQVFIEQPQVTPVQADLKASVRLTTEHHEKLIAEVKCDSRILAKSEVETQPGENRLTLPFTIKKPRLWWSNGLGKANLYTFLIDLKKDGKVVASREVTTGLRSLKLVRRQDTQGETFYFELNGIPVFAKGVNAIPNDVFLPRISRSDYEKMVTDAANANMNMIRIWGGGIYEDDYFYELCDRHGIMVWQDFMFACAMYPGDPEFLENVKQEAVDNVIRLRNHPCIALWCGNNEIDAAWRGWGWKREYTQQQQERIFKAYTDVFHRLLPEVIEKYTDGDDYWPSSPMSGPEIGDHEIRPANRGDNHYWGVWHEKHKFEEYEKNIGRFISEHGFQSFPEFETVRQYTLPEDYDIESEIMSAHQRSGIGNLRIREYMGWYYQVPEDFGQMLYMSQVLQARAMRIAMETHRRHMPYCMGSLVWQLNDCWPVASWSTTDYYHNWKAAQYALREACKPVILAPQLTADSLKLWVVNDLPTPLAGTYTLEIKGFDGKLHQTRQGKYKIKANEAAPIAASSIAGLLQDNSHRETMAVITIRQGKKIVDRQNVYFALPKELLLRQPDIQIQISEEQGKKYLTAITDRLACDVMFYLPGVKAVFTDNYKDLLPGHPFRTEIRTPLSKEEIEQQIRCRWVGK